MKNRLYPLIISIFIFIKLIDFILHNWGKEAILELVKNNGDVNSTFGLTDKEFEKQWEFYIKDKFWFL